MDDVNDNDAGHEHIFYPVPIGPVGARWDWIWVPAPGSDIFFDGSNIHHIFLWNNIFKYVLYYLYAVYLSYPIPFYSTYPILFYTPYPILISNTILYNIII